jgi:hypothetical protein
LIRVEEETKKKTQEVSSIVNTSGMSGRERYMAKRRQRNAPKKDSLRESQESLITSTGIPFLSFSLSFSLSLLFRSPMPKELEDLRP